MGVESNGVMHKKWIRNERKTENREEEGEGWDEEKEEKKHEEDFNAAEDFFYSCLCK